MCVTKTHFYDTEEFACRSEGVRHLEKKVKMYTVFLWQQQRLTNKTGMWRGHTEQFGQQMEESEVHRYCCFCKIEVFVV